jgi:hypothetical protein
MAGVGRTRACAYPRGTLPARAGAIARAICWTSSRSACYHPARRGPSTRAPVPATPVASGCSAVCGAWSDRVVSVVAPSWRLVFENSIAWGSSTASGRSVDRSRFYKKHRTVMVSWASPRHRFLTSSGLTAGPFRGSASDQLPSQHTALLSSSADLVSRLGASTVRTVFHGEFDPGSGRTLAACLTHASRAERLPSGSTRAANG